jgi:hypothetical protein
MLSQPNLQPVTKSKPSHYTFKMSRHADNLGIPYLINQLTVEIAIENLRSFY